MIRRSATKPVWQWSNAIRSDNEEGEVVLPQCGGEDNKKKADGEDLDYCQLPFECIVVKVTIQKREL